MFLPTPHSFYSSPDAVEHLQESHRSRCSHETEQHQLSRTCASLARVANVAAGGMFSQLLRKSAPQNGSGISPTMVIDANDEPAAPKPLESVTVSALSSGACTAQKQAGRLTGCTPQHPAVFRTPSCSLSQLTLSLDTLRSGESTQKKVQAASTFANLMLRPELVSTVKEPQFLEKMVESMRQNEEDYVKRFIYMALVRLVGHREMAQRCVEHKELLSIAVGAASIESGSSWRQAARALAIMAAKARGQDTIIDNLTHIGVLRPVARLLELEQTEFKTDAICAFASWTTTRNNIQVLAEENVFQSVLKAMHEAPSQAVVSVGTNLLVEVCKNGAEEVRLDASGVAQLCEVCCSSQQFRPIDGVLCTLVSSCDVAMLRDYAAAGGARRLEHFGAGGEQHAVDVALARFSLVQ
eukprot:CAMPEP_0181326504 /NCGR_PEP_ID=MMETSP1101-20121128/21535_1 /TAXON_ID=46948 /ORGANISM="Rhodomonas abbreviata, Strain Caron Lab Isolate" /LENGTH=410 /DNA_ID=CAMNT_0023434965 /DNA_START=184 /DNA_END=1416 /DNA_ORIENTATION=-